VYCRQPPSDSGRSHKKSTVSDSLV
jgi:hypothetical protein